MLQVNFKPSFEKKHLGYATLQHISPSLAEGHFCTKGQWFSNDCIYIVQRNVFIDELRWDSFYLKEWIPDKH